MTDREKLIGLIQHEVVPYFAERIADHLIANGVTFAKDINVPDYDKMDFCGELCNFAEKMIEKAKPTWIPVTERLPDKKGEYLVAYHPCYWETVHDAFTFVGVDTFRGKTTWAKKKFQRITHWMPLPEPPKEGE